MCGIVGMALQNAGSIKGDLIGPLAHLEYRGYDSCGYATTGQKAQKAVGKISSFQNEMKDETFTTGIAHTRWATHGGKTSQNAHPHHNKDKTLFAVHNGIIENYLELKQMLETRGYIFITETDTEIIPHYFDYYQSLGYNILETIRKFYQDVRGTYAVLLIEQTYETIFAFKKDSPLVLGVGDGFNIVASDIYAFSDRTQKAIFFDDYQSAVITSECVQFYNINNEKMMPQVTEIECQHEDDDHDYAHAMIKEINEQPKVASRLFQSLRTDQEKSKNSFSSYIDNADQVFIVACGTSYHAGMVGRSMLLKEGLNVHCTVASEFDNICAVNHNSFVIAISQSGETMDVVTVLKQCQDRGAKVGAITNSPYSTIERLSDVSLNILAGQEVAVASTKAFTNQVIALMAIASDFTTIGDMETLPIFIEHVIKENEEKVKDLAAYVFGKEHVFFLGRRALFPVALEMALKLKEISYIHAEGMMAGELKHGTLALIDPEVKTPVVVMVPSNDEHMRSSVEEVKARGATTIVIGDSAEADIYLQSTSKMQFAIGSAVIGQMLSYYAALLLDRDIDQPRNLAKSVTVG